MLQFGRAGAFEVGVHTLMIRSIEKVLSTPGWSFGKVAPALPPEDGRSAPCFAESLRWHP